MRDTLRCLLVLLAVWTCRVVIVRAAASASGELPRVDLNANRIGPRAIEDLTMHSVPRDYALAWQMMERALEENRPDLLDAYWTGFAKDKLRARIQGQMQSGVHTVYQDRGHQLDAIFYAPGGDAMQLRDHAQLELQVFDGGKLIYQEPLKVDYLVVMTPGADRWLVRELEGTSPEKP
jgi:hypothetical protein